MKGRIYPKLAWEAIGKNRRLYFPYILTGCVMVMVYDILCTLRNSPSLASMRGGSVLMTLLPLGYAVITVFSVLFLFYTNTFLIRQRFREFGLYHILGMDKRNIGRIMVWESLLVALMAIVSGLIAGIILSKAAELLLLNLLDMEINFDLSISLVALRETAAIYGCLYLLLLLHSLIRVGLAKPLELLQSSQVGEREPRRIWLFAGIGVLLLAGAYTLALSIDEPISALFWFFVAVLMVILGTYLLFTAGSVVFCRLLQRSKRYYYQAPHFVSVSSMVYRMKRNGAGLASICILLTMVLVMISSSACLYFGVEEVLRNRCPNNINISYSVESPDGLREEDLSSLRALIRSSSGTNADLTGMRIWELPVLITAEGVTVDLPKAEAEGRLNGQAGFLNVIPLEDYNRLMGLNESLADDECIVSCERLDIRWDSFTLENGHTLRVKQQPDKIRVSGNTEAMVTSTVYLIVNDVSACTAPLAERSTDSAPMTYHWRCGFDTADAEEEAPVRSALLQAFSGLSGDGFVYSVNTRHSQRQGFYDMYGSLFFLGLMLSIVFLLAAVLIIYYKQLSEGYEDRARFAIMQNVGMTGKDIRKSIDSQMLTVFYLPLLLAGIHLAFAFPFFTRIFRMFAFDNDRLTVTVLLVCFAVFGLFYALVYAITSHIYYRIVSGGKDAEQ